METQTLAYPTREFTLLLTQRGLSYLEEEAQDRGIDVYELCQSLLAAVVEQQLMDVVLD